MDEFDVVVIGAGAAGIAAARKLAAAGRSVRVVESRGRLGGRAWTWRDPSGLALDLGCGWLHSARRERTCRPRRAGWVTPLTRRRRPGAATMNIGLSLSAEQGDSGAAIGEFFARLDGAGEAEADQPADRLLEPGGRWNPLINAISTYMNGVELDRLSVKDFWRYHDSGVNWRVAEGYGTLIAALGAGLDIMRDCPGKPDRPATGALRAHRDAARRFARTRRHHHRSDQRAVQWLRFNSARRCRTRSRPPRRCRSASPTSCFCGLDGAEEFPKDSALWAPLESARTGGYHMRPFGRPMIEGYFGGSACPRPRGRRSRRHLPRSRPMNLPRLGGGIRKRLHPIAASAWARDPHARRLLFPRAAGTRGCARRAGCAGRGRLFFAGEACSEHDFSTAHGAWRTGIAAAEAAHCRAATASR